MYSVTLRSVLRDYFDVHVGAYSYGSLCEPGMADRSTTVGRYVSIGPGVRRFGAAHPVEDLSLHPLWFNPSLGVVGPERDVARGPCVIESDAWIGANAIILPGCRRIGYGAIVGAGSIVTRDVPDFTIVAGNPARQIGERLSAAARARLLAERPWDLEPAQAIEIYLAH